MTDRIQLETCASCHLFVEQIKTTKPFLPHNIHTSFAEKKCSKCHNPHSARYRHLLMLDQSLDKYRRISVPADDQPPAAPEEMTEDLKNP